MRDGRTRQLPLPEEGEDVGFARFKERWQASLVVLSGDAAGSEFALDQPKQTVGRGQEADLRFADPSMSSEHAVFEFFGEGYRVRDLGSRNGTHVNGSELKMSDLKHGDRLQLGSLALQFVLIEQTRAPKTYSVPAD